MLPPLGRMASKMSTVSSDAKGTTAKPSSTDDSTLPLDEVDKNISIELITEDDAEEVLKLLKKFFFKVR